MPKMPDFQKHCCCRMLDPFDCYRARHPHEVFDDDAVNGGFNRSDFECECHCHSKISEWLHDEEELDRDA